MAVDKVSLTVEKGQIVGLIGPNGAGKTTMIDALCGFHTYEGSVVLAGQDVTGYSPHRRAAGLGRTFQLAGVSDDLTVEENVQVGQHRAAACDPEAMTRLLDELGLLEMRDLQVSTLSQGQRQLVSLALSAGAPHLLLLDEPAAGLDSTESLWLADRLRSLRDAGHDLAGRSRHEPRVELVRCHRRPRLRCADRGGTPDEVRTDERVSTAYLGATQQHVVTS